MSSEAEQIFHSAEIYSDGQEYVLVRYPPSATIIGTAIVAEIASPFAVVIVDKDEVTLVIPSDLVTEFGRRIPEYGVSSETYRLLTFDQELESSLVGFIAHVSRILADENIPILPLAAFSRDHLLIPTQHYDRAIATLETFRER